MPRLIPRLLERLQSLPSPPTSPRIAHPPPKRRKCLLPQDPAFSDFSHLGRSDSILLDAVNPIMHRKAYKRHKALPPRVEGPAPNSKHAAELTPERKVQAMSESEQRWWANPYLRMLSSPLRKCVVTSRHLPTDFLIRLSPRRLPAPRIGARNIYALLPDGLEHPKFKHRYSQKAFYIVCRQAAVDEIQARGIARRLHSNYVSLPSLAQYVGHMLRLRVLQELELLADRIQFRRQHNDHIPVLRRLTRAEFKAIRENSTIPYDHAVAVLVVPPLNRDPHRKERPTPNISALPDVEAEHRPAPSHPLPPLSTLYPITQNDYLDLPDTISPAKVPLYNGISLFPSRPQRAALHDRLARLLKVEHLNRKSTRRRQHSKPQFGASQAGSCIARPSGDDKASHAFLLCSSPDNLTRGDVVPLAVALWRLRMWEGTPWTTGVNTWVSLV